METYSPNAAPGGSTFGRAKKGIPPSMPDVVASQLRLYLRPADPKWHDIKEIFHHV